MCHESSGSALNPTILASIRERLLTLPPETVVRTGHGDNTTIAAERETLAKVNQ